MNASRLIPLLLTLLTSLMLFGSATAAPKSEVTQAEDTSHFNPHTIQSPSELLDKLYQFENDARGDTLELHFRLLEDWLAGLDPDLINAEPRDPHFAPPITFTERILLSWDLSSNSEYWEDDWDNTRSLGLADLHSNPEHVGKRYHEYTNSGVYVDAYFDDEVLVFAHQIAAARIRSGGAAWRGECLAHYRATVNELLADHPEFREMSLYAARPESLETAYEDPAVQEQVWRLRTILNLLTASGPEGYEAILNYRDSEGPEAFLPYPEKIALAGGGLGMPLLRSLLENPDLTGSERQHLLRGALERTRVPITEGFWFGWGLATGEISLYGYSPEQHHWLQDQFRDSLVIAPDPPIDPTGIFPYHGGPPSPPEPLQKNAVMLLEFADPLAEVRWLLARDEVHAQAMGLATLAMELADIGFWSDELPESDRDLSPDARSHDYWNTTEARDLELIQPYFESDDPLLRDLALMLLLKLARSPAPLAGDRATITLSSVPLLYRLQEEGDPKYRDVPRVMALSMVRRGIGLNRIRSLVPSVEAFVDQNYPYGARELRLEILSFNRALSDPAQNPPNRPTYVSPLFDPAEHQAGLADALKNWSIYDQLYALSGLIGEAEALVDAGVQLEWQVRRALRDIAEDKAMRSRRPDFAARITALLDRK